MVNQASAVLIQHVGYVLPAQKFVDHCFGIAQQAVDVLNAFASKPTGIRSAETLLGAFYDFTGNQTAHRAPQYGLAVICLQLVYKTLARYILVHRDGPLQISEFVAHWNAPRQIY